MTNIEKVISNFNDIYRQWAALPPETQKEKINYILPFITCANFLCAILDLSSQHPHVSTGFKNFASKNIDDLQKIITDFGRKTDDLYEDYDKAKSFLVDNFREVTAAISANNITDEIREALAQQAFDPEMNLIWTIRNYYSFIETCLPENAQGEISYSTQFLEDLQKYDSSAEQNFYDKLGGKVRKFQIIIRPDIIASKNNFDEDETRLLNNDLHGFAGNINYALNFLISSNKEHLSDALYSKDEKKLRKFAPSLQELQLSKEAQEDDLAKEQTHFWRNNFSSKVGFEIDFKLDRIFHNSAVQMMAQGEGIDSEFEVNDNLKRYFSSHGAKYNGSITPFLKQIPLEKFPIGRRVDLALIINHFTKHIDKELIDDAALKQIRQQILNFNETEIYFYKLLFLSSPRLAFEVNEVFDPRKSDSENLHKLAGYIQRNLFYKKLCGGTKSFELSVGPFEWNEAGRQLTAANEVMNFVANECGLFVNDAVIQLNLSFQYKERSILMPSFRANALGYTRIYFNKLALQIIKLIEETLFELASKVPGMVQPEYVKSYFDRIKNMHGIFEPDSPYLKGNRLDGKGGMVRVSRLNSEIAVVEIRRVGPYSIQSVQLPQEKIANHPEAQDMAQILLQQVMKKVAQFIEKSTEEELETLMTQEVLLKADGRLQSDIPVLAKEAVRPRFFIQPKIEEEDIFKSLRAREFRRLLRSPAPEIQEAQMTGSLDKMGRPRSNSAP